MAVDMITYRKMEDEVAIQEAAAQGIKSMEHLLSRISQQSVSDGPNNNDMECADLTDLAVSKFKKVISLLNRTGHARFRRGPTKPQPLVHQPAINCNPFLSSKSGNALPTGSTVHHPPTVMAAPASLPIQPTQNVVTLDFTKNNIFTSNSKAMDFEYSKNSFSVSASSSSFMSSAITGDGSVSNGKCGSSIFLTPAAATSSAGKPNVSVGFVKKICHEHGKHQHSDNQSGKGSASSASGSKCHCSKKRKSREKKTVRVPAISSKIADIPPDEYSWRKYGQKPIKGSPYPRGYYKCSTVRGCPAKKHVERDNDDPTMLIVTYSGDHRHTSAGMLDNAATTAMPLVFESGGAIDSINTN